MYAPVCTRLATYDVQDSAPWRPNTSRPMLATPEMVEWIAAARLEPDDVEELEMEF